MIKSDAGNLKFHQVSQGRLYTARQTKLTDEKI